MNNKVKKADSIPLKTKEDFKRAAEIMCGLSEGSLSKAKDKELGKS